MSPTSLPGPSALGTQPNDTARPNEWGDASREGSRLTALTDGLGINAPRIREAARAAEETEVRLKQARVAAILEEIEKGYRDLPKPTDVLREDMEAAPLPLPQPPLAPATENRRLAPTGGVVAPGSAPNASVRSTLSDVARPRTTWLPLDLPSSQTEPSISPYAAPASMESRFFEEAPATRVSTTQSHATDPQSTSASAGMESPVAPVAISRSVVQDWTQDWMESLTAEGEVAANEAPTPHLTPSQAPWVTAISAWMVDALSAFSISAILGMVFYVSVPLETAFRMVRPLLNLMGRFHIASLYPQLMAMAALTYAGTVLLLFVVQAMFLLFTGGTLGGFSMGTVLGKGTAATRPSPWGRLWLAWLLALTLNHLLLWPLALLAPARVLLWPSVRQVRAWG